jgi:hypothetical protein
MNVLPQQVGIDQRVGHIDEQVACSPRKKQKTSSIPKVGIAGKGLSDSTGVKKSSDKNSNVKAACQGSSPNKRKSHVKEARVGGAERKDLDVIGLRKENPIDLTNMVDIMNYPNGSRWNSTTNLKTERHGTCNDDLVYLDAVSPDYTTSHVGSTNNDKSPYDEIRCIPAENQGFVDGNDKNHPVDLLLSDDDSSHGGSTTINCKSHDSRAHGTTPSEPEVVVVESPVDSISVDTNTSKHSSNDSRHIKLTATSFFDKGERKSDSNPTENPCDNGCCETSNRNDSRSNNSSTTSSPRQEESCRGRADEKNDRLCDEESQETGAEDHSAGNKDADGFLLVDKSHSEEENGEKSDADGLFDSDSDQESHSGTDKSDPDGLFADQEEDGVLEHGFEEDKGENSDADGLFDSDSDQESHSGTDNSDPDGLFADQEEDGALEHGFLSDDGNDELDDGCVLMGDTSSLPTLSFRDRTPQRKKLTEPKDAVLYEGPDVTVFLIESKKEQYFLKWRFGDRLIIRIVQLTDSTAKIQKKLLLKGAKCSLIAVKLIENKGGNAFAPGWQKFATTSAKAFYVACEGPGYETMDLEHELNKLANFGVLENAGKIASRLELMVSPAAWSPSRKSAYQFALKASDFEEIPEQGNDGCGFFPETFFDDRLGITDPSSVCAHQVRVYVPKLGYFKGMLVKKQGITKIQLPPSMKKVDKSTLDEESPDWAFLLIRAVFPSDSCKMVERSINPNLERPPQSSSKDLERLKEEGMIWNLLLANGVPKDALETYAYESQTWEGRKQAPCVGVADPTGKLPADFVFVSGLGTVNGGKRQSMMCSQLFVTRSPCTEKKDGILLRNVRSKPKDMPQASWDFLCSMPFGMLVFSNFSKHASKSLPEQVNDGDLDGDLYMCYWDEKVLDWISNAKAAVIPEQSKCSGNVLKAANRKKAQSSSAVSNRGWFAKVQDNLADVGQLRSFDRLTKKLHTAYKKAQKEASYDPDDETTLILGQAFKNSIDLRKHGGKVGLPADLWGRVKEKTLQKFL